MSAWTTLPMAKKQVGIPLADCDNDDFLRSLLERAEAIVLRYINNPGSGIAEVTAPDIAVSAAMYIQFAELWRNRGDVDDDVPKSRLPGALSVEAERCILSRRLPSLG